MANGRAVLALALTGALAQCARAYLQPLGDSLEEAHATPGTWQRTHGDMFNAAVRLMKADGRADAAAFYSAPEDVAAIMNGLRQADSAGGSFVIQMYGSTGAAPRNSFSHFYNPVTDEGFVFPLPNTNGLKMDPDPEVLLRARWEFSLLAGPFPAATGLVEWEYAQAVSFMRAGLRKDAFEAIARGVHIMQDLTVPHHATDKPSGLPGTKHTEYEAMCEQVLLNGSKGIIPSIHPESGGIYCDSCPPTEFVQTAANQSARFIGAAQQPETPQAEAVAGVLMAASDKLSAGLLHRFFARWKEESFAVLHLSIERVKILYKYRKKGDEGEHFLLGKGRDRQADVTAVVVMDGDQKRTSTARNCNDVRPRILMGSIDIIESQYKGPDGVIDCASIYKLPVNMQKPNDDKYVSTGWHFTKRIENVNAATSVVIQVVILDDLIPQDDRRVDVSPAEDRKNLVFEYNVVKDEIVGVENTERLSPGVHMIRAKGDKGSGQTAAITVKLSRAPLGGAGATFDGVAPGQAEGAYPAVSQTV